MTAPLARTVGWPSSPKVLVHAIAGEFGCYASTRFPGPEEPFGDVEKLAKSGTAVVRVVRLGGDRNKTDDHARVAVDVIADGEGPAEDLAESIATWAVDTSPIRAIGLMIDRAVVEVPPHEVPYADPTVTQFSMVLVTTSRRFESRR